MEISISEIIFLSDLIYLTVLYNLDFWVKKQQQKKTIINTLYYLSYIEMYFP